MSDYTQQSSPINAGTLFGRDVPAKAPDAFGPRGSFVVAYDRLATLGKVARRPSMVVAAVGPYGQLIDTLLVEDRRSLVIGRHARCGLRLDEQTVSLRHLALLVRYDEQQAPVVHLWDLNTGHPFLTEDQQSTAAVIAEGPVYVQIGPYSLWIVPSAGVANQGWPTRAEDAWQALPTRQYLDRRTPRERSAALPNRVPAARFSGASVTLAGAPLVLEEDCDDEIPWGELRIELVDFKQKNRVSAERLEHGVLIGRYDRCGITFTDSTSRVSRVHLLIVRIDNEIWAIDTASTHGLWRGGHKVTAVVLTDPDQLALGNAATVRWRRLGMAAA